MKIAKYFSATWCGPCKAFKPVMNEVAGEGYMVEFLDVDNNSEMASKYGVRSVPTTIIEENGVEVNRFVGAIPKQQVIDKLLQMKVNLPNHKYVIYERDIVDILIAFNDGNYEWILDFFETLTPVDGTDNSKTYSFEQLLANAGITFQGK